MPLPAIDPLPTIDLTASSPPLNLTRKELPVSETLKIAINVASSSELRATLHAICAYSSDARITIRETLATSDAAKNRIRGTKEIERIEREEEVASARKRKAPPAVVKEKRRPRLVVCKRCLEDFDANANERDDGQCVSHPGEREADYNSEVWCDWDEECHGNIDGQGDEFPQGFKYTCCGEPGDSSGCRVGRHKEDVGGRSYKRVRR